MLVLETPVQQEDDVVGAARLRLLDVLGHGGEVDVLVHVAEGDDEELVGAGVVAPVHAPGVGEQRQGLPVDLDQGGRARLSARRAVPSSLPVAASLPSGENATAPTRAT